VVQTTWLVCSQLFVCKAVILLVNIQINKYTNDHCRTVPIRWCLLCICFFFGGFVGAWAIHNAQMHKCTNNCSRLIDLLTGIRLWAQICAHLNFELCDCLITFPIFVLSQRLIAGNVRELFSFNRGIPHLNEARRIDYVSRGSLSYYEILTNN
jgi:hypothetical protein